MNIGLYPKIAYEGMRKNGKLYIPYCITCILMVAIYYIVHFLAFSGVLIGIPGASTAVQMLGFGVYVITIFSAIFLFYTQSTLIKGRKKEFGLYSVLGMNKNNLGMIIFYDWDDPDGEFGPQDGKPDHTGIVERVVDGVIYTIEGNSGDSCRRNEHPVGEKVILGFGVPRY